jgi:ketosteroid isomerase-like protein
MPVRVISLPLSLAACALLVSQTARADDPAWTPDEQAIAAADTAFHEASIRTKEQAWRDFASDEATLPAGRGKDDVAAYYAKVYARPGFTLDWRPAFAKVFGDIGVTSGPFEMHQRDKDGRDSRRTGSYVTVWNREKDGAWRFVWDGGSFDK